MPDPVQAPAARREKPKKNLTPIEASEALTAALKVQRATEAARFTPATASVEVGKKPVPLTGAQVKERAVKKAAEKVTDAITDLSDALNK